MPELPEIETLSRLLRDSVVGKTIIEVECTQPKMINLPLPEFSKRAKGLITAVGRRGKSVVLFEADGSIWLHLGLVAEVRLLPTPGEKMKPVLSFRFDDETRLHVAKVFMGKASFVTSEEFQSRWDALGIEPLSEGFTTERIAGVLASKPNAAVKAVLMDQALIAGIGNLYSDEILRGAGVNPLRKASTLAPDEVARLHTTVGAVLAAAIAAGGEVGYTDLYGHPGRFEPAVHGREACGACGSPVNRVKVQGRTGYFCTRCNP